MAWIELHQEIPKHPKTLMLASLMGWSVREAVGTVAALWLWCVDFAEDGDLRRYNDAVLASAVGLAPEDGARFVDAMVKCGGEAGSGFMDREPYFRVHDWWRYFGRFLQVKYKHKPLKWKKIQRAYLNGSKNSQRTVNTPKNAVKVKVKVSENLNGESPRGEAAPPVADDRVLIGGVPYRWPSPEGFVALSLDPETWNSFVDYRRTIREPLTPHAEKLAGKKLAELRALGQDAKAVIEQSILNHWSGLFPVKNGRGGETKSDALRKKTQEILKRGLE